MDDQNKNKKKRIDLASLYPVPKTYDELQDQHAAREARMLARQPKYAPIMASIGMSIAVLLLVLILNNMSIFLLLGAISGVFSAFLVGLLWFGFTALQVGQLSNFFNQKGYSPMPFYAVYSVSALALLSTIYTFLTPSMLTVFAAVILAIINIALINLLASIVVTKSLKNSYKIGILSVVVIFSVTTAIVTRIV